MKIEMSTRKIESANVFENFTNTLSVSLFIGKLDKTFNSDITPRSIDSTKV